MAFLSSMDITASALTAQRMRMDVIAQNMANVNVTRTAQGEPYQRRYVVLQQKEQDFAGALDASINGRSGAGVRVAEIRTDETTPFKLDYNPDHPDAGADGYVRMPNVEPVIEMVDMMSATRSYEANLTIFNSFKNMALKALEIGR